MNTRRRKPSGSVLIIVLWVAFGLVSLALYFGHSMSAELRAADNRVASLQAEQAIAGAIVYVSNILATTQLQYPGTIPDPATFRREAVPVGDAHFWLIGRADVQTAPNQPSFNLVDEGSKLNLNSATVDMLESLPRMTPQLAAAIVDWRDVDSDVNTQGGAEDETYQRLIPAYRCKNSKFESPDELRLVYGMDLDTLYGEDPNLNGVLDLNENDGDQSFPLDNRDGRLDPGLMEYLTVFSTMPTVRTNGSALVNVTNQQALASLFTEKGYDETKASQILQTLGFQVTSGGAAGGGSRGATSGGTTTGSTGNRGTTGSGAAGGGTAGGTANRGGTGGGAAAIAPTFGSILEFYMRSGMSPSDFAGIENDITTGNTNVVGMVNVNTASAVVLSAVPGIGLDNAPSLVSYRQNNQADLLLNPTVTWVTTVLGQSNIVQAGPYLTGHSYQIGADIAAVGRYGRGYRRTKVIFDISTGTPRVMFRQDLTSLGWALGQDVRNSLALLAKNRP